MDVDGYLYPESATIREVAAAINATKAGFALIVDAERKLVGTVTDGDLRRSYLAGRDLDTPVSTIMCARPVVAPVGTSRRSLVELARRHRIHFVPLLDERGHAVLIQRFDYGSGHAMQRCFKTAVVMAGGEGNRLRPFTENLPKPMIAVDGKPILEHIVTNLSAFGIERLYLSVNYKAEMIFAHFGDGQRFGVSIDYLHEKQKLGTAGSLTLLPTLPEEPILVINGDVLTDIDYTSLFAFHIKHRGVMTVATAEYKVNVPFGTVEVANQFLINVVEKPVVKFHCNAGIYALEPEALQYIPSDRSYDMTTLMTDLIRSGLPVSVFPVHEHWMDIGRPEDLDKARAALWPLQHKS